MDTLLSATALILSHVWACRELVEVYPDKRFVLVSTNDAATLSLKLGCDIGEAWRGRQERVLVSWV